MNPAKVFIYSLSWVLAFLPFAAAGGAASAASGGGTFSAGQLDQMLSPVALYPDSLLAQVLIASTYPLEVVEADRWVKQNSKLKGASLNTALDKTDWDASIKALVPFPQVLSMMSEQLEWTRKVGDAFLSQQQDVMDSVQRLRAKAQGQGSLKSTKEEKVIVEEKVIRIEPLDPQVIYVPVYDPVVVYGPWPYPAYPPLPPPPYYYAAAAGVGFAAGVAVGAAWSNGWGHWNWNGGTINVNVNKNINVNNLKSANIQTRTWQHDPDHRKGVAYRDDATRQKYAQKTPGSADARRDYRGHTPDSAARPQHQTGYRPSEAGAGSPGKAQGPGSAQTGARRAAQRPTPPTQPRDAGAFRQTGFQSPAQNRPPAFDGMRQGAGARDQAERGRMSRQGGMGAGSMGGRGGFHGRR